MRKEEEQLLRLIGDALGEPNVRSLSGALRMVANKVDRALERKERITSKLQWGPSEDDDPEYHVLMGIIEYFNPEYR